MGIRTIALDYMMDNGMADTAPKVELNKFSPEPSSETNSLVQPISYKGGTSSTEGTAVQADAGSGMTQAEKEMRHVETPAATAEYQETLAEKEMRESANKIAQEGKGAHFLGGRWQVESKKVPEWLASTMSVGAGAVVGSLLTPKDNGQQDHVNNAILSGSRRGAAVAAGVATDKFLEPWLKENLRYPSISYTPDPAAPLTPEQQAMVQRNQQHKQRILEAMNRDGVYNPGAGPDSSINKKIE